MTTAAVKENAYQIKPDLENIIPDEEIKKIITQILNETLFSKIFMIYLFIS